MFGFETGVFDIDFIGIYRFDKKRKLKRKKGKKTVPMKGMRRIEVMSPEEVSEIGSWAVEKILRDRGGL